MWTTVRIDGDETTGYRQRPGEGQTIVDVEGPESVRVDFPEDYDREEDALPVALDWVNSAGISFDEDADSVTLSISTGDPRGAFTLQARRLPDGRIVLHVPYPEDPVPHEQTRQLHQGTLVLTRTEASDEQQQ